MHSSRFTIHAYKGLAAEDTLREIELHLDDICSKTALATTDLAVLIS
jgi:hypothetical protein